MKKNYEMKDKVKIMILLTRNALFYFFRISIRKRNYEKTKIFNYKLN